MDMVKSYRFKDNTIVTSMECRNGLIVYSKLLDDCKIRELLLKNDNEEWEEKCHKEIPEYLHSILNISIY